MGKRARELGGDFRVDTSPGRGTEITLRVPTGRGRRRRGAGTLEVFLSAPTTLHRYETAGTKRVRLQVRDSLSLTEGKTPPFDDYSSRPISSRATSSGSLREATACWRWIV